MQPAEAPPIGGSSQRRAGRRDELVVVAARLFAARGYHGTRMDDIADAAGLNKATVYHYFASKALILHEIYFKAAEETLACLQDDPQWSAREALYQCTSRVLALIASNREQAAVYFQENPFVSEWLSPEQVTEIRKREDQVQERVQSIIERGIGSGEFIECDSHVLALGYIGMTLGSYRWLKPTGRRSAEGIAVEFSMTLLRGLIRDDATRQHDPLGVASTAADAQLP
jgi:AcrR family transcriptional regulator